MHYERALSGVMIHLDTKKLGRIDRVGRRVTGRGPGAHKLVRGWDFLHFCMDDAPSLAQAEILPSACKEDTTTFVDKALTWLSRHGVKVEQVMTDNGSAYRSGLFRKALAILSRASPGQNTSDPRRKSP